MQFLRRCENPCHRLHGLVPKSQVLHYDSLSRSGFKLHAASFPTTDTSSTLGSAVSHCPSDGGCLPDLLQSSFLLWALLRLVPICITCYVSILTIGPRAHPKSPSSREKRRVVGLSLPAFISSNSGSKLVHPKPQNQSPLEFCDYVLMLTGVSWEAGRVREWLTLILSSLTRPAF